MNITVQQQKLQSAAAALDISNISISITHETYEQTEQRIGRFILTESRESIKQMTDRHTHTWLCNFCVSMKTQQVKQQTKSYDYEGLWRLMKLTLVDEGIIQQWPSSVTRSLNYIRVQYSVFSFNGSRRSGLTVCMYMCVSFIYSLQRFTFAGGIIVLVNISRDDIQSPSVKHNIHS